jgi:hypothetical protein
MLGAASPAHTGADAAKPASRGATPAPTPQAPAAPSGNATSAAPGGFSGPSTYWLLVSFLSACALALFSLTLVTPAWRSVAFVSLVERPG